jgi:hypothetical protein
VQTEDTKEITLLLKTLEAERSDEDVFIIDLVGHDQSFEFKELDDSSKL